MATVKLIGVLLLLGFVLGSVIATLVAPSMLTWYNTGADVNAMCNCATVASSTSFGLIRAQLTGGVVGAVVTLILGIIISRARAAKTATAVTPPTTPPSPS